MRGRSPPLTPAPLPEYRGEGSEGGRQAVGPAGPGDARVRPVKPDSIRSPRECVPCLSNCSKTSSARRPASASSVDDAEGLTARRRRHRRGRQGRPARRPRRQGIDRLPRPLHEVDSTPSSPPPCNSSPTPRSWPASTPRPLLFGAGGDGDPHGKSFGDWLPRPWPATTAATSKSTTAAASTSGSTKAALAEASGVTGGYTVPPEFYQQLMTIMAENTFIRPRAFVMPMAGATLADPVPRRHHRAGGRRLAVLRRRADVLDRRGADPHRDGAAVQADGAEGLGAVRLLASRSNVLLQDSVIGLEKFLMTLFAKAIAWFEEYAFLQGNGVGKPQGMLDRRRPPLAVQRARDTANQRAVRRRRRHVVEAAAVSLGQGRLGVLAQRRAAAVAAQGRRQPGHLHQHRPGHHQVAELDAARPAGVPHREGARPGHQGRPDAASTRASTSSATACRSRSRPASTSISSRSKCQHWEVARCPR